MEDRRSSSLNGLTPVSTACIGLLVTLMSRESESRVVASVRTASTGLLLTLVPGEFESRTVAAVGTVYMRLLVALVSIEFEAEVAKNRFKQASLKCKLIPTQRVI